MRVEKKTVCNRDCPDACSIVATVEDGRVVQLGGDPDHPVTQSFLCWRTNNFLPLQYSASRITQPLLHGKPVSWDEAMDYAARELTRIRAESGPAAIFHYRSGGSLGALKHLTDYFFELFGPVTMKSGDICSGAGDEAQLQDFGLEDSHDIFDLLNSRNVILWGKNVVVSSPHLIPILQKSGASLLQIDPVWQKSAKVVDAYVQPRPAGDFALAMAVARVLFERGWTDPAAPSYCENFDEFRALAFSREDWALQADVSAEQVLDIARRLHEGPTAILVGWGMARRLNGGAIVRALDALGAISGNLGIAGGGVSYYFWRRRAFDFSFIKGLPAAPRAILDPLFGPGILEAQDPPVRAVWITSGNPVAMLPESQTSERALRSREFVCVVDSWHTDTTRCATLVLPHSTLLESDDLMGSYGHHFVGASQPVVQPPVPSDLEIMQMLASRVGLGSQLAGTAREWKQRILRRDAGFSLDDLEQRGPQRQQLSPKVLFEGRKFNTPSGKARLLTTAPVDERPSRDYPLWLMSLSTEKAQGSQWSRLPEGPAECRVHPDAAQGIPDGALARLESRIGGMVVRLRHDAAQRRDIALVPKGGHLAAGRCANALVKARTTDLGGGGALYDEGVRLVPA